MKNKILGLPKAAVIVIGIVITALFLVPGVAFDKDRHRCGYGKGFYDRYLSRHTQHATVAMALDFQIVETVPSDVYDICPQMLITPTMIYGK